MLVQNISSVLSCRCKAVVTRSKALFPNRSIMSTAMKAVVVKQFGGIEQLNIDDVDKPKLNTDSVLIKVHATALNRADILQRQGKYPPPPGDSEILGLEASGTIEELPPSVVSSQGLKAGDRVMSLLGGGGYAQYCAVPASMLMPVPAALSFEQAASIPEAFLTAYQALFWHAQLPRGLTERGSGSASSGSKTVLIHAAASGVGVAAIQLAKLFDNVTVIATVGSDDKAAFVKSLGADVAVNYKTTGGKFAEAVLEASGGRGADIVIDFIGASYMKDNLASMATDGTMVVLAVMGGTKVDGFDMGVVLRRRLTIKGSTLRARSLDYKAELTRDFAAFALPRFADGRLKPVVDSVFDWKDVRKAHTRMEDNLNLGKIVLTGIN
eukprot:TRINITY_DN2494_c0_g1_i2.p1 TRINITY_DN2494_c0_g1~~TRINITY_DN2494_c0_g1_i2.p1  ORF type:complete len:395 (+),score=132.08 TRINITY_DN2494_c0_g1_i2:42-1187(+)